MEDWAITFQNIAKYCMDRQKLREGDYYEGEILYCGKCREARREYVTVRGQKFLVTKLCACDIESIERENARKEEERAALKVNENKSASNIDPMYATASLATFDQESDNKGAYNLAKNYVAQFPEMLKRNQGLLFWGDVGTGKTYTACCIANELLERGHTVYSLSFAQLFQKVNGYSTEQEEELMERVKTVDLLILDDLGAERSSDYGNEKVYAVIDTRYRIGKPTIFTTNMTLSQMKETYDIRQKRLYDRIFQTCFPLQFNGNSRRVDEARERYYEMVQMTKG